MTPVSGPAQIAEGIDQCMNDRVIPDKRDPDPRVPLQGNAGADSHELNLILRHGDIGSVREVVNDVAQIINPLIALQFTGRRIQLLRRDVTCHSAKDAKVFPDQFNHFSKSMPRIQALTNIRLRLFPWTVRGRFRGSDTNEKGRLRGLLHRYQPVLR